MSSKRFNYKKSSSIDFKFSNCLFSFLVSIIIGLTFAFPIFASPYTLCTGKEFNQRVKAFLNGNDRYATIENTITAFQRGYNPPDDPAYYVDVSEDLDGSVIVYTAENDINNRTKKENRVKKKYKELDYNYTLYWYSDGIVTMNQNTAYMFDKFVRLRNIDLSDFAYVRGLTDTRYMFLECRNLKNLTFKKGNTSNPFMLAEMQGMFYSCQSLSNIDLTLFDTKMVDNMNEVFCNCYNLKNIYVDTSRWNIENVRSFNRMFSQCHLLRSNDGRKAVDVPEDEYEKYAVAGNDTTEGFIKNVSYQYSDYGEYLGSVPIDGEYYLLDEPETTQPYVAEPEYDSETGNGLGDGIIPYVGDKSTGYSAVKETTGKPDIINPTADPNSLQNKYESTVNNAEQVTLPISENGNAVETSPIYVETTTLETSIIERILENETDTAKEIVEASDDASSNETGGRRIMELDDYLKEQGKEGDGGLFGGILNNYKFLIFALAISAIVILLLLGMVAYLTKSNRENKDKDSHKI